MTGPTARPTTTSSSPSACAATSRPTPRSARSWHVRSPTCGHTLCETPTPRDDPRDDDDWQFVVRFRGHDYLVTVDAWTPDPQDDNQEPADTGGSSLTRRGVRLRNAACTARRPRRPRAA